MSGQDPAALVATVAHEGFAVGLGDGASANGFTQAAAPTPTNMVTGYASGISAVPPTPAPIPGERTFTSVDIANARREEKDKLYKEIEELRNFAHNVEAREKQRVEEEAEIKRQLAEVEEAKRLAELSALEKIQETQTALQQQLEQERQERGQLAAALELERQYQALNEYRAQAIAAVGDAIMPHLVGNVTGNSVEEIDASIAHWAGTTTAILNDVRAANDASRRGAQGSRVTTPPSGPMENFSADQQLDIANMDMATYAANRDRLLGAAARPGQGIFG